MKRNVASQTISAVVVSATDGSAITTGVSVTVTGDGGTQGAGGGTATHEGGGEWSYAPTQAETNFDHIMFKFSGTGAIPVGVQVYTTFPQTGDGFARLGAPAGASVSADIAAIEAQTDDIGAAGAGLTALATAAALTTVDTVVDAIKAKTDSLTFTVANQVDANTLSISGAAPETSATIADAVWDEALAGHVAAGSTGANQNLIDDILVDTGTTLMAEHDATQALIAGLNDIAVADILAAAVESNMTVLGLFRLTGSILAGKLSGAGTGTEVFRNTADAANRVTVTADADGNRTAVTLNL